MKLRKYIVKQPFKDFLPNTNEFEIVEEDIPPLKNHEFLVKAKFVSVDPYMRSFAKGLTTPYPQFGFQVGKVIETKNPNFSVNSYVVSHSGWQDYVVLKNEPEDLFNTSPSIPIVGRLPLSLSLGALGMPGITAYLGLMEICKPLKGQTVCVTSAAGAVGTIVGQIAGMKECKVIGIAGSDKKIALLRDQLGFHHAFNYKTENIKECLRTVAPEGIDCFFDNVGGELSATVMECMNSQGTVAICGAISLYGNQSRPEKSSKSVTLSIEAFSFTQWDTSTQKQALHKLMEWLDDGSIKAIETITNGFERLPETLIGMLRVDYIGKAVVKV